MAAPLLAGAAVIGAGIVAAKELVNAGQAAKKAIDQMAVLIDEVAVTVTGNPLSNKRDLYFLAAAVGFGLVQRLVPAGGKFNPLGAPGRVGIHYDAASKEVSFLLQYQQSLMTAIAVKKFEDVVPIPRGRGGVLAPDVFPGAEVAPLTADLLPVLSGPRDFVVGKPWNFGLPAGIALALDTPDLPFTGKTILTSAGSVKDPNPLVNNEVSRVIPTPNPRPSGDARSRGSLCWLVYQSLATPAESYAGSGSHTYPLPTAVNRFSGG